MVVLVDDDEAITSNLAPRPGRRPLSSSPALRAGPLRMDRIARRAWLLDAELALTPKAMHFHLDFGYLYGLFRLSIHPLQGRDSLGYGRAVAVSGCP